MGEFEDKLNQILNNPQELEKIVNLARGMMGGDTPSQAQQQHTPPPQSQPVAYPQQPQSSGMGSLLDNLDAGLMKKLARGFSGKTGSTALLQAVTPHLGDTRKSQLKRAITVAQMVKVARSVLTE